MGTALVRNHEESPYHLGVGRPNEGYETIGGVAQRNRRISGVSFGAANPSSYSAGQPTYGSSVSGPGTYYATWTSYDGANKTGTYYHYGRAVVTNIDSSHPNHS